MSAGLADLADLAVVGFAAVLASFVVINLGLRVVPEGRAFLDEARAAGRLLANPRRSSPPAVKAVFAAAALAAMLAAVAAWQALSARPFYPWPSSVKIAETAAGMEARA